MTRRGKRRARRPPEPSVAQLKTRLSQHELAVEQLKAEEKERLLGVFPDFFVSYEPNAAPLSAAQKFQLGRKTIVDPVTVLSSGIAPVRRICPDGVMNYALLQYVAGKRQRKR
jgi:hypothetical protein